MEDRAVLAGTFLLGVLVQLLMLSRGPFPRGRATLAALFSLVAFAPFKGEVEFDGLKHLLPAVVVFGFLMAILAKDRFLPVVKERMVWAMTLVLWFVFLVNRDLSLAAHQLQGLALLVPTSCSLFWCWSNRPMGRVGQIANYLWFMGVVVLLGVWGYQFSPLALFDATQNVPWITPLDGFLGGMTFMLLVMYGSYLYHFLPIPAKTQSIEDRMKEWRSYIADLAEHFHDSHSSRAELIAIALVLIGIFATHYWVEWMSPGMVVGLALTLLSIWSWATDSLDEVSADATEQSRRK